MSSYVVRFTGYIDERKRPENFPKTVEIIESYGHIESTEQLKMLVNNRVTDLAMAPGLIALKNPTNMIDASHIAFNKRRFIPWHMITHLEMQVELIPEPISHPPDPIVPIDEKVKPGEPVN